MRHNAIEKFLLGTDFCGFHLFRSSSDSDMRPVPNESNIHPGLCALLYNAALIAGILSFCIAQALKPVTNWCGFEPSAVAFSRLRCTNAMHHAQRLAAEVNIAKRSGVLGSKRLLWLWQSLGPRMRSDLRLSEVYPEVEPAGTRVCQCTANLRF